MLRSYFAIRKRKTGLYNQSDDQSLTKTQSKTTKAKPKHLFKAKSKENDCEPNGKSDFGIEKIPTF